MKYIHIMLSLFLILIFQVAESADTKFILFTSNTPTTLDAEMKSRIHDNMSLSQVVSQLGVGWMSPLESVGFIDWFFSDYTRLRILPHDYHPNEIISFAGDGGTSKMWLEKGYTPANTNLTRRSSGTR